ncbi:MAG: polysaccharide deacetylase family protein [Desulfobacter sp.]|nr:MAG: polysaccharide deacetylase family protein [Desulfobacter sp.]
MKYSRFASILFFVLFSCAVSKPQVQQGPVAYRSASYAILEADGKHSFSDMARIVYGDEKKSWKIEDSGVIREATPGGLIALPLKEKNRGGIYENGYQSVPILCYHKFGEKKTSEMNTPARVFRQQMKYLKENEYRVISPEALLDFLEYRRQIPKKAVMITIDDGFRSAYEVALPILEEFGYTATVFVYTDYIGVSKKALSWADLRILKSKGFTIGSHSVSHSNLIVRDKGETREAFLKRRKKEIFLSKQIIDKKLNQETRFFSFPYGKYDSGIIKMAHQAGYKLAVTVDRGSNPFFTNPLALKRDMILKKDMASFVSRLKTFNNLSLK